MIFHAQHFHDLDLANAAGAQAGWVASKVSLAADCLLL